MKQLSDKNYNLICTKLPIIMRYCRIPASDIAALNAARQLTIMIRQLKKVKS